ncbi:MAG TPA: hypothetical protein VEC11_00470 [Allosphingosinicella sp.]|nr:hypothetical protein [Allosphingosinicella sp.]
MSLAAALVAFALQAAAGAPCTAEDVRTASIPPEIAWMRATVEQNVPAEQRRWFTAALGADLSALAAPGSGFVALPLSPFDYAFFAITGDRMKLHLCRGTACQIGYDGPKREIAWASTYTQNMPDLVFDRTEVQVFDRGRYRRVCRVTFETP